ncbi:hypothetical protein HPQ64_09325 [Rhizobiales bacterium]|uniref:hypothetical protein n=1 Tax=Hongsoonwoonella zoysiae TaxID=2821844 RepID=UPI00155F7E88|nr:hypothetical protein [Hongsoonwoonella zoysiae]NRG17888.1 hypothetical protein [Hongsoonwoonella zoysiae]
MRRDLAFHFVDRGKQVTMNRRAGSGRQKLSAAFLEQLRIEMTLQVRDGLPQILFAHSQDLAGDGYAPRFEQAEEVTELLKKQQFVGRHGLYFFSDYNPEWKHAKSFHTVMLISLRAFSPEDWK